MPLILLFRLLFVVALPCLSLAQESEKTHLPFQLVVGSDSSTMLLIGQEGGRPAKFLDLPQTEAEITRTGPEQVRITFSAAIGIEIYDQFGEFQAERWIKSFLINYEGPENLDRLMAFEKGTLVAGESFSMQAIKRVLNHSANNQTAQIIHEIDKGEFLPVELQRLEAINIVVLLEELGLKQGAMPKSTFGIKYRQVANLFNFAPNSLKPRFNSLNSIREIFHGDPPWLEAYSKAVRLLRRLGRNARNTRAISSGDEFKPTSKVVSFRGAKNSCRMIYRGRSLSF